jgi:hypothetical protein
VNVYKVVRNQGEFEVSLKKEYVVEDLGEEINALDVEPERGLIVFGGEKGVIYCQPLNGEGEC